MKSLCNKIFYVLYLEIQQLPRCVLEWIEFFYSENERQGSQRVIEEAEDSVSVSIKDKS